MSKFRRESKSLRSFIKKMNNKMIEFYGVIRATCGRKTEYYLKVNDTIYIIMNMNNYYESSYDIIKCDNKNIINNLHFENCPAAIIHINYDEDMMEYKFVDCYNNNHIWLRYDVGSGYFNYNPKYDVDPLVTMVKWAELKERDNNEK